MSQSTMVSTRGWVNIPSTCQDPDNRYKMPRLEVEVLTRKKMKLTRVININDVARELKRHPEHIMHWFGNQLGAQTKCSKEDSSISGERDALTLQKELDGFIEKDIICFTCKKPEIELATSRGNIEGVCRACGTRSLRDGFSGYSSKLAALIAKTSDATASQADEAKLRRMNKKALQAARAKHSSQEPVLLEPIATKAASTSQHSDLEVASTIEHVEPESGDASAAHSNHEFASIIKHLKRFIDMNAGRPSPVDFVKEVCRHQFDEASSNRDRLFTVLEAICGQALSAKLLMEFRELIERVIQEAEMVSSDVLGALSMCLQDHPDIVDQFGTILKFLCEEDWADEQGIAEYYAEVANEDKPGFKAARRATWPLYKRCLTEASSTQVSLYVAIDSIFGEDLCKEVLSDKSDVIERVIRDVDAKAHDVLGALSMYLLANPAVSLEFGLLLKFLYDKDLAEEDDIVKYYSEVDNESEPGFREARNAASLFLRWLEEAESEDDSEGEEGKSEDNSE
mmetsp:Transcript_21888/g.39694  ORF Transcript_21888/g.39694 Transcript_21888/m.39694 type:complete len:512 (-) Transcript_21888:368-1903(-)